MNKQASPRMTAMDILVELQLKGVELILTGNGSVRVRGPRRVCTLDVQALVAAHRSALIEILRDRAAFLARGEAEWTWRGGRWVWTPEDELVRYAERLFGSVTEVHPLPADLVDSVQTPPPQAPRRAALARWQADHRAERPLPPSILWECPICREAQRTAPGVPTLWCTGLASTPHVIAAMERGQDLCPGGLE